VIDDLSVLAIPAMFMVIVSLLGAQWVSLGKRLDKIDGSVCDLQGVTQGHDRRLTVTEERGRGVRIARGIAHKRQHDMDEQIMAQLQAIADQVSQLSSHCVSMHGVKIGERKE
jgi:hypothetical protein